MPLFWTGSTQSGLTHLALNAEFNEDIITRKTFIFIEKKELNYFSLALIYKSMIEIENCITAKQSLT